jgi:hypothetical protein
LGRFNSLRSLKAKDTYVIVVCFQVAIVNTYKCTWKNPKWDKKKKSLKKQIIVRLSQLPSETTLNGSK